jgi:2-polyprenyl-3-methyl-5-hydroxy-6-metoxy-1,4-benzoquinol methylase
LGELSYASVPLISSELSFFRTTNLLTDEASFRSRLAAYMADEDSVRERTNETENQNPHMVKFHWGHDHDFGTFELKGEMGTRHIWMLSRFFDHFGVAPTELAGREVLDVGCWTGGVSLILNRLGARVTAIDEVRKYTKALGYLAESFGLKSFVTSDRSLYELDVSFREKFDVVFCLGVIYHLSDPIVGLRRLYNVLKPDGMLCVESMGYSSDAPVCDYEGPTRRRGNFGWNWFVPSPRAMCQWLEDTGFRHIQIGDGLRPFAVTSAHDPMGPNRCFAVARKDPKHKISIAGLSAEVDA